MVGRHSFNPGFTGSDQHDVIPSQPIRPHSEQAVADEPAATADIRPVSGGETSTQHEPGRLASLALSWLNRETAAGRRSSS
jgi:hypothetical protein